MHAYAHGSLSPYANSTTTLLNNINAHIASHTHAETFSNSHRRLLLSTRICNCTCEYSLHTHTFAGSSQKCVLHAQVRTTRARAHVRAHMYPARELAHGQQMGMRASAYQCSSMRRSSRAGSDRTMRFRTSAHAKRAGSGLHKRMLI
uniref:Uncharacterized protein n=1 Tax=Chrysotila carterae TaxID=13221 RepID=A0A7S4BNQ5_CHRCT